MGLLVQARSNHYALLANRELPPTKEQAEAKRTDWHAVEQSRERALAFMERHERALHHPYYFEEYMGLPHVFDEPKQKVLTAQEIEDERRRILHEAENIWS